MRCEECEEMLAAQLSERLPEESKQALETHLRECRSCALAQNEVKEAQAALQRWETVEPPAGLAQRTISALADERARGGNLWERVRQFFERQLHGDVTPLRGTLAAALGVMFFVLLMNVGHRGPRVAAASSSKDCGKQLQSVQRAVERYAADHQGALPQDLDSLVPDYLSRVPNCPQAGFDTYSAGYRFDQETGTFRVSCDGHFHQEEGLEAGEPSFEGRLSKP